MRKIVLFFVGVVMHSVLGYALEQTPMSLRVSPISTHHEAIKRHLGSKMFPQDFIALPRNMYQEVWDTCSTIQFIHDEDDAYDVLHPIWTSIVALHCNNG